VQYGFFNIHQIERFYSAFYDNWKPEIYYHLMEKLDITDTQRIATMSCGQRSQVAASINCDPLTVPRVPVPELPNPKPVFGVPCVTVQLSKYIPSLLAGEMYCMMAACGAVGWYMPEAEHRNSFAPPPLR